MEENEARLSETAARKLPVVYKILKTVFLILTWVCIGLILEITGPTLQDLKLRTNTNYEQIARAVSGRSVGYFIGSAAGGILIDKLTHYCDCMIGMCLTFAAVATAAVPWSDSLGLIWFLFVFQGTCEGVINNAGQRLIILLWQKKAASPLHALHMGFGFGSFIVPLISNPFMADRVLITPSNSTNLSEAGYFNATTNYTAMDYRPAEYTLVNSRIEYAYGISGIITFALAPVFYFYQFCDQRGKHIYYSGEAEKKSVRTTKLKEIINPATCANGDCCFGTQIFVLLFFYFFNLVGIERICGKFIRAYAIDQLQFSKDDGTYLNTAFWVSFTVGRFSGFVAANWIPIRILILIEVSGALFISIILNIFAGDNRLMLWIFAQPLGFFVAPLFPSGIGWGNHHVEMTGIALTVLLCGAGLGGVSYLWVMGYLYDNFGPRSFLFQLVSGCALLSLNAIILTIISRKKNDRYETRKKSDRYETKTQVIEDKFDNETNNEEGSKSQTESRL